MPTYFFKKGYFLWYGEAGNPDDALTHCLKEMDWKDGKGVKFVGADLSEEEFLRYRYHIHFQSPCEKPLTNFEYGFVDEDGKFMTPEETNKKFGLEF